MRRVAAAVVFAALLASPASAEEITLACLSAGHTYQVGDFACIPACHGKRRYARCELVAEKASWTFISDVCPTANLTLPDPSNVTITPVATAMSPIPIVVNWTPVGPGLGKHVAARTSRVNASAY